jgi:hypothetical protein
MAIDFNRFIFADTPLAVDRKTLQATECSTQALSKVKVAFDHHVSADRKTPAR